MTKHLFDYVRYADLNAGLRIKATFNNPGHWKQDQVFTVHNALIDVFYIQCEQGSNHFLEPQTDEDGYVLGFVLA